MKKNLHQTCKKFSLHSKNVLHWIKDEEKIKKSGKGSKCVKFERRAENPEIEEVLYREYKELRSKGLQVRAWWFQLRAKEILDELQPQAKFCFSDGWFLGFKKRHSISKRQVYCYTAISSIHRTAREGNQGGQLGQWTLSCIANMDQTPLPFTFSDGETYADKGDRSVWVYGGASGLEK